MMKYILSSKAHTIISLLINPRSTRMIEYILKCANISLVTVEEFDNGDSKLGRIRCSQGNL